MFREHNAKDDEFPVYFDGILYIWLVRRQYQCHQGKDKSKAKKLKCRNKVNSKLLSDHQSIITKTRKLTQPTKTLDCPVTFHFKKLFRFPEFKIDTNTKWNRSVASQKLRNLLEQIQTSVLTEQNKQENMTKSKLGHLEYVTRFPSKKYLINCMKFCANIYSKIIFVRTTYVRFLCL